MENKIDQLFCELIHDTCSQLKNKFTSKDIHKKLKIRNNPLKKILNEWVISSIIHNKIELINTGKNKNGEITFMTWSYFKKALQQKTSVLDFQLDENKTYLFLREISQTDDPNVEQLTRKIENFSSPLIRFDKGSRNTPIILNLYKNIVPLRLVTVTQSVVDALASESHEVSESQKAKKVILKEGRTNKKGYDNQSIVISAFSLMITEIGKLVFTKEDIINSRGYKVYFNSLDFEIIKDLIKTVYPFSPYLENNYICLFPENWLDIKRIQKQILEEDPESFLRNNYPYINDGEIKTLLLILNQKPTHEIQSYDTGDAQTSPEKQADEKKKHSEHKDTSDIKIASVKQKKVQKHIESEPLKFLDEIIHRENGNESSNEKLATNINPKSPKEILNELDNEAKHFLLRILDSTNMKSGYYSHSINDEKFKSFIETLKETDLFSIEVNELSYIINRNSTVNDSRFKLLREELDNSILENNKEPKEVMKEEPKEVIKEEVKEEPKEVVKEKVNFEKFEITDKQDDFDDFILDQRSQVNKTDETKSSEPVNEDDDTLIIINNDEIEEPLKMVEKEIDEIVENNFNKEPFDEAPANAHSSVEDNETIKTTHEPENLQFLTGKVISVLTENEEKYLTIELISRSLGFQLRDGLAYKPDIAVLEESYRHLAPIAENSGAFVMPMKKFLNLIDLKE